uniref:CUB_2 domain-containing protein n=1 Tax=Caenorhabditis tropicalis TaxID=1561998 RepID=A0A1I7TUR1_9PELO
MLLSLFLSSLFIATTSGYQCNVNQSIVYPPSDLSQPLFYPDGWTDRQGPPLLDPNQDCFITVNIPNGYYATVNFHKLYPDEFGSYVLYSNNKYALLDNNDPDPYIFVFPRFKVSFSNGNTTQPSRFGFKVVYTPLPDAQKTVVPIIKGQPPVAIIANNNLTTFVGETNSMMSLMAFGLAEPQMEFLYRSTAVFGGDSFNDDFIGTLDLVLSSKTPLTTYGNKISVYTFGISKFLNYPLFMGQDAADVRVVRKYYGANCKPNEDCTVNIDGSFGHAYIVTDYEGSEYVKGFDTFPSTATLNVYENNVSNTTRIATLTNDNYRSQMPLEVKGVMKFYELVGSGHFNMAVTRTAPGASRLSF